MTTVSLLAVLQSILMVAFFYAIIFNIELIDVKIPSSIFQTTGSISLMLGLGGLLSAYGLWRLEKWGYWGAVLTSISTIIFSLWGSTIQFKAVAGMILPITLLAYIIPRRRSFLGGFKVK